MDRSRLTLWTTALALAVALGRPSVAVAADPPLTNLTAPTIAGTARVDSVLDASDGTWSPAPTSRTYQWFASGVLIPGATTDTYIPKPADVGKTLKVKVTAHKTGYTSTKKGSALTAAVVKAKFAAAGVPTIEGTVDVGEVLTAAPHLDSWTPSPTSLGYQWLVNGLPVSGATSNTFTPTANRVGKPISVQVTGRKAGYKPKTVTSDPVIIEPSFANLTLASAAAGDGAANGWTLAEARYRILTDTNAFRAQNNKPPLWLVQELDDVAQEWTQHMASANVFLHHPKFWEVYPSGWTNVAENIAAGQSPDSVVADWITSEGHRANLLGPYNVIGIGYARDLSSTYDDYYTQNFGKYPTTN